jgi:hypothetical protein
MPAIRPERRALTAAETALVARVFGSAIDASVVTVRNAKFWMFHPWWVTMAPDGHIWCHPNGFNWCADYAAEPLGLRAHFVHEMTHVWQHQQGRNLLISRPPFARYGYTIVPGKPFTRYGIEQQACLVADAYLAAEGRPAAGKPTLARYAELLPFGDWNAAGTIAAA